MKAIIDTNIFLLPQKQKIDIFQEINRLIPDKPEITTLTGVIDELRNLSSSSKDGIAAKIGLELIKSENIFTIKSIGNVDDYLVNLSTKEEIIVATNDGELKKRLRETKTRIITSKGRDMLQLE